MMNCTDGKGEEEGLADSLSQMHRLSNVLRYEPETDWDDTSAVRDPLSGNHPSSLGSGKEVDNWGDVQLPLSGIKPNSLGSTSDTNHGFGHAVHHHTSGDDVGCLQLALGDPFNVPNIGEGGPAERGPGYVSVDLLSSPTFPCASPCHFQRANFQAESLPMKPDYGQLEVDNLGQQRHTSPQQSFIMPFHTELRYQQVPFPRDAASTMPMAGGQSMIPELKYTSLALQGMSPSLSGLCTASEMELLRRNSLSFNSSLPVEQAGPFLLGPRGLTPMHSVPVDATQPRVTVETNRFRLSRLGQMQDNAMSSNTAIGYAIGPDDLMETYYARLSIRTGFASFLPSHQAAVTAQGRKEMSPQTSCEVALSSLGRKTNPEQKLSSSLRRELAKKEWKTSEETILALQVLGTTLRSRADPYFDASTLNDPTISPLSRGGVSELFPDRLYRMLSELEAQAKADIAGWLPHRRAFLVYKPDVFVREVLPAYSKGQSKWSSFSRQLNLYGFQRLVSGIDAGAYYHELFLKNRPNLVRYISRVGAPTGIDRRRYKLPDGEDPDFYTMSLPRPSDEDRRLS